MGVFARPDSPYWWMFLETTKTKERTEFKIGTTGAQKRDSRRLADDRYHQRMNEVAARLYKLPSAQPAIRFDKYAEMYERDTIAHHRGATRERELLKNLRHYFDNDLLSAIDPDRVRGYMTSRKPTASARTINREVDVLKAMLRDAAPKYLAASPLKGMRRLSVIQPKRRLLSVAEERKLLKVGDAQDRALLILGIDTLIRLSDLLDLRRADHVGPWLYVRDPKSGQPYEVALSPRAQKALAAVRGSNAYVFEKFRRAENPRDWSGSVRQRLQWLCAQVNIPYGRTLGGVTFHWSTRRTGATRLLVGKRVPIAVVQRQGNWKKPNVLLEIYAQADKADLLRAVGATTKRRRRSA